MISIGRMIVTLLLGIAWWIFITLVVIFGVEVIIWFLGGSRVNRAWIGGFASIVAVIVAIVKMIRFNK